MYRLVFATSTHLQGTHSTLFLASIFLGSPIRTLFHLDLVRSLPIFSLSLLSAVYFESSAGDERRRKILYEGGLFVFSSRKSAAFLCALADELICKAFGKLPPREAQSGLVVEEYAAILAKLKPNFIHHARSKECIQAILTEYGCDLEKTYFDVPRLRTSTSNNYLTTGIAFAWHPHRDTWYSAPQCQLNWWIPVYDFDSDDGIAFHPRYWTEPLSNNSQIYNYYEWNTVHRATASQYIKEDPRPLPRPTEKVEIEPQIRPVCPAGGLILFSGAQLHPAYRIHLARRFSIDFRTVHIDDVAAKRGAPNVDSRCTGTSLRDFLRASDFSRIPDHLVSLYNDGTETPGDLIYKHSAS